MSVGALIEFYFKLIICITIPEEPKRSSSSRKALVLGCTFRSFWRSLPTTAMVRT
ncbi:unknown protein [Microcystis aeruginosa NIES-843]|uniref:Uncharacterized protein n=1 Tax=Microcystis aeruginosa (strain NIES-843 / IAM M-2473) TaxID=449447 RepID=B0JMH9_MICAN|nr:unknown protein [Microcystis aeruginosa NIES-843]